MYHKSKALSLKALATECQNRMGYKLRHNLWTTINLDFNILIFLKTTENFKILLNLNLDQKVKIQIR